MKLKWLTSLVVLLALTGSIWGGVCGCFGEQEKGHSCCKKDTSGRDYMSAKSCCAADCETVVSSAGQTPQKNNPDTSHLKGPANVIDPSVAFTIGWFPGVLRVDELQPPRRIGDNRLRFAHGPDLYLRHNSFLI